MRAPLTSLPALICSATMLASPEAWGAEGRTSSLSWLRMPGAEPCIATQALARRVEERLGRHVFVSAAEADVSVEGRIEKREGPSPGWHAEITVRDGKGARLGTRELERPEASCEAMNEPLALIIAVMIDPEARLSSAPAPLAPAPLAPAPEPAAPPSAAPAPDVAPEAPASPARGPAPKEPWRFEAAGGATLSSGLAPRLAPGAVVSGILFPPGLPLGFRGYASLFLPTEARQGAIVATVDLFYVGGALCPTLRGRLGTAMLCFGGQLGVLRSHAEGPSAGATQDTTLPLVNAVTEVRVSLPLAQLVGLNAGMGGVLPLARPTFEYTAGPGGARGDLHQVSRLGFVADAGIAFFFP